MAEIKSTMELVMERAARMGRASDEEVQQEKIQKSGMKLAADFLDGTVDSLMTTLTEQPQEQQVNIRSGMVEEGSAFFNYKIYAQPIEYEQLL
ncbi:MAG: hypothetical protein D3905_17225, partial [Candidatus Electrothrix sp. AS4_5]|nr:hypothetical protein [Candidatus Electrothrix gigas]